MQTLKISRRAYVVMAWLLLASILVQVFLAGLAMFFDAEYWARHTSFVHVFELLPLLLFATSFPARLRGFPRWLPLLAFGLIGLQYATVEARPSVLAALHPVNAVLIAWIALRMARTDIGQLEATPDEAAAVDRASRRDAKVHPAGG